MIVRNGFMHTLSSAVAAMGIAIGVLVWSFWLGFMSSKYRLEELYDID